MRRFADVVEGTEERGANNPVGILGHGSDIAYMVLFLCSPVARFISGQVIAVDGAASIDQSEAPTSRD